MNTLVLVALVGFVALANCQQEATHAPGNGRHGHFRWERRTLDCKAVAGAQEPKCSLIKGRNGTAGPVNCRFETKEGVRRYTCDLECEGAKDDSVAMQRPNDVVGHPCVQVRNADG